MFYAHIILAKKGPLARVWLAAHWDKKITKAHVFETNIEKSVEGIMQPKVKLALRTSGHLLLGVVRIYSRKAKYLLADCNEAFVKIKMAFRPGMVDLPEGHREANVNAITLPEVFHDFDTALPELNDIDIEAQFSINQSRADEITMREDYGSLSLSLHDDGFGDIGFEGDTPDLIRGPLESNLDNQLFDEEVIGADAGEQNITLTEADVSKSRLDADGFGDEFGQPQLFEDDLFGEPPLETNVDNLRTDGIAPVETEAATHFDEGVPSPASSGRHSPGFANEGADDHHDNDNYEEERQDEIDKLPMEQSTLIQNEDESFALAPIDASAYKGVTKAKRKRKLIVDEVKNISGEEMKAQLANTSDIVTTLDLAPPTKRLMYWKETGGVEKLFALPSRTIPARALFLNYSRHLISRITTLEDFSCLGPSDLLALDQVQNEYESPTIIGGKRGRKRKHDVQPPQQNIPEVTTDTTAVSLAAPDGVREQENAQMLSHASLDIGVSGQESLGPSAEGNIFDAMRSPGPMFSLHDIGGMDNSDDFHHDELHHGQMTPHHTGIENIESIPNLPADQVSSILNEAENMPSNTTGLQIASDWNEFDFPPTIGLPQTSEEQMENETTEQFEERVLNKRAAQLFFAVKSHLVKQDYLYLSELTVRNTRKQAAQKFYSLLVLKKFRALNITQSSPYSDIVVTRGQSFENPKL